MDKYNNLFYKSLSAEIMEASLDFDKAFYSDDFAEAARAREKKRVIELCQQAFLDYVDVPEEEHDNYSF